MRFAEDQDPVGDLRDDAQVMGRGDESLARLVKLDQQFDQPDSVQS